MNRSLARPVWNPNLDDGVIINFAPHWRLATQNNSSQKELEVTWDALGEGKCDWAHRAMHLWPVCVVPKYARDRSLAIAHDQEEVSWEFVPSAQAPGRSKGAFGASPGPFGEAGSDVEDLADSVVPEALGTWAPRRTPTRSIEELVRERTSPSVRSALKSLLEAPALSGAARRTGKGTSHA